MIDLVHAVIAVIDLVHAVEKLIKSSFQGEKRRPLELWIALIAAGEKKNIRD